jgi:hypothetical protein
LLALHAPGLIKTWTALLGGDLSAPVVEGCFGLSLSFVFFVLKIAGVSWLAFRTDRRSLTVLAVALVLMHAGPIGVRDSADRGGEMPAAILLLAICSDRVQSLLSRAREALGRILPRPADAPGW